MGSGVMDPDGPTSDTQVLRDRIADLEAAVARLRPEPLSEALAASERRLRDFLDMTDNVVTQVDAGGCFLFVNRACAALLGVPADECVGLSAFDFIHPDDRAATQEAFGRWIADRSTAVSFENRNVSRSGEAHDLLWTINPQYEDDGDLKHIWSVAVDVTERKRVERELRIKDQVFANSIAAQSIADVTGTITHVNPAFLRMWGHASADHAIGTSVGSFFSIPADAALVLDALAAHDRWEGEFLARRVDGSTFVSRGFATTLRDPDGQVVGYQSTNLDVTAERKHQERFVEAQRVARMGSWEWDASLDVITGSQEFYRLFDVTADEITTFAQFTERLHPDDRAHVQAAVAEALSLEQPYDTDYRIRLRSGAWRHINARGTVSLDDAGRPALMVGTCMDISARKRVEEELRVHRDSLDRLVDERTAEARKVATELTVIIDAVPGLVFYKDVENRFLRVNQFVADAHGLSKAAIDGKSLFELYPAEMAQAYWDDDLQVIRSGKPKLGFDERWETPAGVRWVSTSKIPQLDEAGDVIGIIGVSLDITERKLAEEALRSQNWLKTGQGELNDVLRGAKDVGELAAGVVACAVRVSEASMAALYLRDGDNELRLVAGYAHDRGTGGDAVSFAIGQGLVGQAAADRHTLRVRDIPPGSVRLVSGLVEIAPVELAYVPLLLNGEVRGVLEVGALQPLQERSVELLESVAEAIAVTLNSAQLRGRERALLQEAQRMTERLQVQQEELRAANEELGAHARRLKESEVQLQAQQEELEVTNEELREKNGLLEQQKRQVETARRQIQQKAEEVALASKYKSEFLANMSHELRTPLNSLLLLSQSLGDNRDGNLTADQVECAKIIHSSGGSLLELINEVLDLAKIESGRMDLRLDRVVVGELAANVELGFRRLAAQKGLRLDVRVVANAPAEIRTDPQRVEQILRNLLANAIKFTETGGVTVSFGAARGDVDLFRSGLAPTEVLAIEVRDTGIGIAAEHHKVIFEAFQQAEGGTARRFGGTGLGLSISRELAQLLGGEIQLDSAPGRGSTFTLYLPLDGVPCDSQTPSKRSLAAAAPQARRSARPAATVAPVGIDDDRDAIASADTVILVIEDDPVFAHVLYDRCHERGFKCLAAPTGVAGLELARQYVPSGVVLDLRLPGMDGWSVLAALKEDTRTRHIPVHVVSGEEASTESLRKGAIGHATKPITREQLDLTLARLESAAAEKVKRVLLVEDNPVMRESVRHLIGNGDVKLDAVATGEQAIEALRTTPYACLILDLGLPDMDGAELLARLQAEHLSLPPIIVHTARDLTEREEMDLRERAQSIVIKDVRSQERLLDEVSLFLHRMVSKMPETKQQIIRNLHETDTLLAGKRVLLVDDDMRTAFAVSRLLAERGMRPVKAANGEQALQILEREPDIDLVLMDIMMPVMDGYEAIRRIRAQERFRRLPILALTAKAMADDRQKCIEAGANDYMAKPLDPERLVSMMRVWLYR